MLRPLPSARIAYAAAATTSLSPTVLDHARELGAPFVRYFRPRICNIRLVRAVCRGGGRSQGELGRVFAERKQHADLCHREAAEECRRYTELALQHQQATVDQQQRAAAATQRLAGAGAPC